MTLTEWNFQKKNFHGHLCPKCLPKKRREVFLVEYHDVLPKHPFDVGYNTELKIKLTPEHLLLVSVQGTPDPIHRLHEILSLHCCKTSSL